MPVNQQPHGIGSYIKKINEEYQNQYDTTERIINLGDNEATINIDNSKVSSGPVSTKMQTYRTNFPSLEGFPKTTAGSTGSIGLDDFSKNVFVETGSASQGIYSMLYKAPSNFSTLYPYFDYGDKFRICAGMANGTSNSVGYAFRGRTVEGNGSGYGFKFTSIAGTNYLMACVNKEGTEHTKRITSRLSNTPHPLYAEVDWENKQTIFRYAPDDPGYDSQEVVITEVPKGYADRLFTILCHNTDGSTNARMEANSFMMENGPAEEPPDSGW